MCGDEVIWARCLSYGIPHSMDTEISRQESPCCRAPGRRGLSLVRLDKRQSEESLDNPGTEGDLRVGKLF